MRWAAISLATNAKHSRGDHAQTISQSAMANAKSAPLIQRRPPILDCGPQPRQRAGEIFLALPIEALLMRAEACDTGADFGSHFARREGPFRGGDRQCAWWPLARFGGLWKYHAVWLGRQLWLAHLRLRHLHERSFRAPGFLALAGHRLNERQCLCDQGIALQLPTHATPQPLKASGCRLVESSVGALASGDKYEFRLRSDNTVTASDGTGNQHW